MKYEFSVTITSEPKKKPNPEDLTFGSVFTDHMFIMKYNEEEGWHDGRIVPYAPLEIDPAAICLNYGQSMFEGLKAYKTESGRVQLFRPYMNAARTNRTNDRLCIPRIDDDLFVDAIKSLVRIDQAWIPDGEGNSLYIRPIILGDEPYLGVRKSKTYKFIVIMSPAGSYYKNGLKPTKTYVEESYSRAFLGGTGEVKYGGNYGGSLKAQEIAEERGYDQVLWLDAYERKYIEEIGSANVFFVIGDELVTSDLNGSILPGITRDSVIALCKKQGMNVSERRISINEVISAHKAGNLKEMFASGTASVISPVGELLYEGKKYIINEKKIGPVAQNMYNTISGIQTGKISDYMGWTVQVE